MKPYTRTLIGAAPITYDIMGDEVPTFPPTPQDLDRAKAICPTLELSPDPDEAAAHIYHDGDGVAYYCVELPVVAHMIRRPTPSRPGSCKKDTAKVWCRSTVQCYPGGRWHPDEYDEVSLDQPEADGNSEAYASLFDAVAQTRIELFTRGLLETDNTCHTCFGTKVDNPLADFRNTKPCTHCNGLGFHPLALTPVTLDA